MMKTSKDEDSTSGMYHSCSDARYQTLAEVHLASGKDLSFTINEEITASEINQSC